MSREKRIKKKKLGSYPFVSVVFSVTLALFVMGLFGILLLLTNNLSKIIQENVEVQVFLNKNLSTNERTKIIKTLSVKDYVVRKDGEAQVQLITKEQAAKQFAKETGEDFVAFLGDNPLRDVVTVKISPEFHQEENLSEIKKEIQFIRGVYEVSYMQTLINSINKNVQKIGLVLVGFAILLLLIVVILIHNTIKLALFSQRFLIRSMQLVGATARFIRSPFLNRAIGFGLIAGFISIVLLAGVIHYADAQIEGLLSLVKLEQLGILSATLLVIGAMVGFFSTFAAMKKYMKMSLDELY
ncbi:cell division protein FtsX [Reichenbachiella versicolor]|uniref:cell division protein FtsX n=1 Tax=Reichenbachiella versicolor TaxID=1821036 RepID=UPI000D6E5453|nr:permease-like cell division protein FtsX [Reichenbachiella versicolor]